MKILLQLMAQFRIFPSSESRHSFVANYTSAVKFKIHILVWFCCIIIPLYVSESNCLQVICLVKIISIFPHDPFYEGILSHVSVSVHCIFPKKCFRLKCIFINLSVSACFPIIIKAHPRKKRTFILFLVL